ncbi:hypothetical protein HYW75_04475 [Candidatus Pacearchaeota archaeon]|nr:hypothetical protein [Candidatus Pacearchaeota archaeon]
MQKELKKEETKLKLREGMKINKRGEIEVEQTIKFVLPVLAFLIVLGFLAYLGFKEAAQEDICHLTVISRGTSPQAVQAEIPLKCTTKKICLTDGKGKCDESLAGEENLDIIKLPKDSRKAARIIEETSVASMYNCWKMMGEGKVDIFGNYLISRGLRPVEGPTCVICSRVAIDKGISQSIINDVNLHEYMRSNKVPGGDKTYLQSFTDSSFNTYPYVSTKSFQDKLNTIKDENIEEVHASGREIGLVFMQIKAPKISEAVGNLGSDALFSAGGAFMVSSVKGTSGIISLGKLGLKSAPVVLGGGAALAAFSGFNAYLGQTTAAGYCGALATTPLVKNYDEEKGGGDQGCSIVQAVPYDFRSINTMCANIEGIP